MLKYSPTPVIEIQSEILQKGDVKLLVKREDLNHPTVSGNKWWKLKYNLDEAKNKGHDTILTFGGAYSNHIFSTAAAAFECGFRSIGVIRGEETLPLNHTLSFAREKGMELHYVSRELYRKKADPAFIQRLHDRIGNFYLLPEGGTNAFALKGCREFAADHLSKIEFDYLCLPVGTGGTMAGIVSGLTASKTVIGISVLKDGNFLKDDVKLMLKSISATEQAEWKVLTDYHHGGYAKASPDLYSFMEVMERKHGLPLDHVYTAKLFFAIFEEIKRGNFSRGSKILALHTGGLQTLP